MSLLLDALKQAEQSRKKSSVYNTGRPEPLEQHEKPDQPSADKAASSVIKNDLGLDITPVESSGLSLENPSGLSGANNNQEPSAQTETAPDMAQKKHPAGEIIANNDQTRLDAQNVFAVKRRAASKTSPVIRWGGLIIILLILTIIALFFFVQNRSVQTTNSITETVADDVDSPASSIKAPTPGIQPIVTKSNELTKTNSPSLEENAQEAPIQNTHITSPPTFKTTQLKAEPDASPGIKITKRQVTPKTYVLFTQALSKLQQGDLDSAEQDYQRLLTIEPDQVDALLGLANIMVQKKQLADARRLYQQILKRQPNHLLAKSGLINIELQNGQTVQTLNKIKQLIIENPKNAMLHIVLGDFFARNKNWPAAQSAYFKAVSIIPDKPDYLFNLAVSLDHLNKHKAASKYYKKALKNSQTKPANFIQNSVISRLQQISANSS